MQQVTEHFVLAEVVWRGDRPLCHFFFVVSERFQQMGTLNLICERFRTGGAPGVRCGSAPASAQVFT